MQNALARLGLSEFRPGQKEVLGRLENGESLFVVMPTGWGKSLFFLAPALLRQKKVVVVSPLVALIEDQYLGASRMGLRALRFHQGVERNEGQEQLRSGEWDILFLTPERLFLWESSGFWQLLLREHGLPLLVVDEAHCVLEWDFREAYQSLTRIVLEGRRMGVQLLAMSATLSLEQEALLRERWHEPDLAEPGSYRAPQVANHIRLQILALETKEERYLSLIVALKELRGPGVALVYVSSRRTSERVSNFLQAAGFATTFFHAGLPAAIRLRRVQDFKAGRLRVVVCTSAFGLGIDYPHIRTVVHWGAPYNLSQYWQEVGRVGRDGQAATALVLWTLADWLSVRGAKHADQSLALWLYWQERLCRRRDLLRYFPESTSAPCGNCDICLGDGAPTPWWLGDGRLLADYLRRMNEF